MASIINSVIPWFSYILLYLLPTLVLIYAWAFTFGLFIWIYEVGTNAKINNIKWED